MILAEKDFKYDYHPQYDTNKNKNKKNKSNNKLKNLVLLIFIGVLSFVLLFRYVLIYQHSLELNKLESNIKYTENLNQQIKIKIASISDPARIEEIAKQKLGMQEPLENQIVYINVGKSKLTANNTDSSKDKILHEDNFFMRILGVISR